MGWGDFEKRLNKRDAKWSGSIAAGNKEFISEVKTKLGAKAIGRKSVGDNGYYELRESQTSYNPFFTPEKCALRSKNSFF